MPWNSTTVIDARREFVALAQLPNANIRGLCERFNISPKTAYKFLNRFRTEGDKGLSDRSHRPLRTPLRSSKAVENSVLSIRADHPRWGARKISVELKTHDAAIVPAPSTINAILCRHGKVGPGVRSVADRSTLRWLSTLPHRTLTTNDLPHSLFQHPDVPMLIDRLQEGSRFDRKRAQVIFADRYGIRGTLTCKIANISPITYRRYIRVFKEGGAQALFARRVNRHRKFDNESIKKTLFGILHQPPSNFDINRTTWTLSDLSRVMTKSDQPVSEELISKIIKAAGFRWRKARVVLTSNDPNFSEKMDRIHLILSTLKSDEAFFSIDEYGPFAVKAQPGKALVCPGELRLVPQWQQSRGCIIVTAAIELSSNQVTHFYSTHKNTAEMIRMMKVLITQYRDRTKLYLSWDAASWHISKELFKELSEHNERAGNGGGPLVETAPLPSRAQFLNVIESVFSGMARAIIHNSDYKSVDEAKSAIDRYFAERNANFKEHPRRAGGKLWGKERTPIEFSDSNNCKDPRLG